MTILNRSELIKKFGKQILMLQNFLVSSSKNWILPVSLATVVMGQIYFSAANYYLGIEHPAWPFWSCLLVYSGSCALSKLPTMKLLPMDIVVGAFFFLLITSSLVSSIGEPKKAITLIALSSVFPYVSARLLNERGIARFVEASFALTLLALPLIGFRLASMAQSDLNADRLSILFSEVNLSSTEGVASVTHASHAVGVLLVFLVVYISNTTAARKFVWQFFFFVFCYLTIWMLVLIGLRAAILASLATSLIVVGFSKRSVPLRFGIIFAIAACAVLAWATLPLERKNHFSQLTSLANRGSFQTLDSSCKVHGNSIETRARMTLAAFDLFMDSPVLGVDAGSFGIKSSCSDIKEAFASPHGIWQQIGSELGLVGIILYSLIVLSVMKVVFGFTNIKISRQWLAIAAAGAWGYFFIFYTISGNYFYGHHLFAMTGVLGALAAIQNAKGHL